MSGTDDRFRVQVADAIRHARDRRRLSQRDLAVAVGVQLRQIGRYETGEQAPSLEIAVKLARVLQVPIAEIAGMTPGGIDLSGQWWAAWETQHNGASRVEVHALSVTQQGEILSLGARGPDAGKDGSFHWLGEVRIWDGESLVGWYRASDGPFGSKGTIYFALHPDGRIAWGGWWGQSFDGPMNRGWGAMARDEEQVVRVIDKLVETDGSWSP
ncbi:helix-turn-helix transcriptional regulator [Nocardia sp. NBC_01329]|uniref:helix-turn-helix transcriptional regulator n=1 Tax=Nocardia sp. NBC_01329 TaxID=2903594 RepID=UPI002E12207D|nr:helix-turn-helix domain-containing protein [Nocardia sp. NBC_01329]